MKNLRDRTDRQSQPVQGTGLAPAHGQEHNHDHGQRRGNPVHHDRGFSDGDHMAVGRPGGLRTTGPSVTTLLTLVTQCTPLLAQTALLWYLVNQGRWIFLALLLPALFGNLALCVLTLLRARSAVGAGAHRKDQPVLQSRDTDDAASADMVSLESLEPAWLEDGLFADVPSSGGHGQRWKAIVHTWLTSLEGPPSYQAMIGREAGGDFLIDLVRDGPHALVAGTTGSGKSVFLRAWCLALACSLPPSRFNLVLLDFKGGSGFNLLAGLPHTVGCVNDLDLEQAVRSLAGIRKELERREALLAKVGASDIRDLDPPPPRLLVVIDEFQALRQQLPDYLDDLARLASQGRSLGMNLVACTQQTLGQVSAQMRANMNLGICLRVRDPMQSKELLGSPCAARISPSHPGLGFCENGEGIRAFRTSLVVNPAGLVQETIKAAAFCGFRPAPPLFSPPLPDTRHLGRRHPGGRTNRVTIHDGHPLVPIGWVDDGVLLHTCRLPITGNTALIGPRGQGKTTLIGALSRRLLALLEGDGPGYAPPMHDAGMTDTFGLRISFQEGGTYSSLDLHIGRASALPPGPSSPASPQGDGKEPYEGLIWLIDDAQDLLDPMSRLPLTRQVNRALSMDRVALVLSVDSATAIRRPERFRQRLVFPFGERSMDMACGIPSAALTGPGRPAGTIPGRCLLLSAGQALPVQCFPSDSPEKCS